MEQWDLSYIAGGSVQWDDHFGKSDIIYQMGTPYAQLFLSLVFTWEKYLLYMDLRRKV